MSRIVDLKDARFATAAEIQAYLTANATLTPDFDDLELKGWLPWIATGYVGLTVTNGYLVWLGGTGGAKAVSDIVNAGNITAMAGYLNTINVRTLYGNTRPFVNGSPTGSADIIKAQLRMRRVAYTLAGGVQANLELVPDPASAHFPVIDSVLILPTDAVAGGLLLTFESPAGTPIAIQRTTALVANEVNRCMEDIPVYAGTDNEAIVVDISDGAGVETGVIIVIYHYET